jgi:hypothetical protein
VILAVEGPLALWRQGADDGEMITGPPLSHEGGLPHRRIGTHHTRQGINPGLIDAAEALFLLLRPPCMAGHVGSRPYAMAASSRCRARRAGFWGRHRMALSNRPTGTGW